MTPVDFGTEPARYRHLRLEIDGAVARILSRPTSAAASPLSSS